MSSPVITVAPDTRVRQAASLMRANDVGALPVLESCRVVGIVTDRDIVTFILAGLDNGADRTVGEAMSADPVSCRDTHSIAQAAAMMGDEQVERLLVVDHKDRLVGMVTVGDIAVNASEVLAGQALGEICEDRRIHATGHQIKPR
jgi:CBS domain-containing protein